MSEAKAFFIGATRHDAPALAPGLYVTATPIGNLGDVTLRALAALAGADFILCEDTRVTSRLLDRFGIKVAMKPYHEHNAERVRPAIIRALQAGAAVVLVSDAGVPLISDPGYRLVKACVEEGLAMTALPGASAVLTALALSGLATDCFTFLGFLPQKQKARLDWLRRFKALPSTLIAFESPHRIVDTLAEVGEIFGTRPIAVARELTKLHEEVLRGTAADIHQVLSSRDSVKGEIVLVIGPHDDAAEPASDDDVETAITAALRENAASRAATLVSKTFGIPKDEIYARILKRKADGAQPAER